MAPLAGRPRDGRIELLAPGTALGQRFEIRDVLGMGGFAVVYRAFDRTLGREVALKVLRQDRVTSSALKRLRREAAIARDLVHPRLVRIFDIEEAGEAVFLTLEVVEGGSLGDRLAAGGSVPMDSAIRWASQALEGLAALHGLGILHRDIKPGNLLLTGAGDIKLSDFGLALHLEGDETRATTHESVLGTLEYLSPEQALGQPIDTRSDLYSLGVVIFELIAGRLPFETQSSLGSLLERLKTPSPDLRAIRAETPSWLAAVVAWLLSTRPADRYASAEIALAELRDRSARARPRLRRRHAVAASLALAIAAAAVFAGLRARSRGSSHIAVHGDREHATSGARIRVDAARKRLSLPLETSTIELDYDGFQTPASPGVSRLERGEARARAYELLREGSRHLELGESRRAEELFGEGSRRALRAEDAILAEWLSRRRAQALLAAGEIPGGLELAEALWRGSTDPSEVAFESAIRLHARGELALAASWYDRALGEGAGASSGRNKPEVVQHLSAPWRSPDSRRDSRPGNVRALENEVDRAVLLAADGSRVASDDFATVRFATDPLRLRPETAGLGNAGIAAGPTAAPQ